MIYNDDDNPLEMAVGTIAAKSAAMLFRTTIGWILWDTGNAVIQGR
jgi:hypothetical protein